MMSCCEQESGIPGQATGAQERTGIRGRADGLVRESAAGCGAALGRRSPALLDQPPSLAIQTTRGRGGGVSQSVHGCQQQLGLFTWDG